MFEWGNMSAENWVKVKKTLREVLDAAPSERRRILENGISEEIRAEVESLLAFENESADFLSLPITDFSKDFGGNFENSEILPAGQKIGIYEITGELGIGGMGAVYLAERTDGKFAQKVAVKMLKREFNVERIRRNFRREREILAKLDHPFIARLLDAGTTEDGVPFLAMEYVEGLPIDRFCEAKNLSLKERLKLFNKVCEAVSCAHQNLIIHRDLKPSNIIVTDKGEPKLLDFGISKLLDAEDSIEKTSVTLLGAMTPEYASPEQIKGETISTATDIYSLGVVLYKMLTGALPYNLNGKTNGDVLKVITEVEPTAPSAIQDSRFKIQDSDSENRKSKIENLKLKGDLDNIILQSLRKEPIRRYKTVEQLSADIWRHIDGLPVYARPSTVSYRAAKFFKRNKISVIAAALIFLSLGAGIAASLRQTSLAREAQRFSAIETEKAKAEQAKSEKITKFMSKIIGYANPGWFAEGANLRGQARVLDAVEDLSGKIDTEFVNEPDVAAEIHSNFAGVFHWVSKDKSEELHQYYQQKRRFHALRGLELRKRFYGEWHELVAMDLFSTYGMIGTTEREKAGLLMQAIIMMRDTNPNNLNLAYMLEAYSAHIMQPEFEILHEPYRNAALPATDEDKYKIAEKMLRESLPIFRLHYKTDNNPIFDAECKLAYSLAMQEDRKDFDEHYAICKQYGEKSNHEKAAETMQIYVALIERALIEKK